jgi:hypothetical protein
MRKLTLAALFCVSVTAARSAVAMSWDDYPYFDVVFSVEGWPKAGPRVDGKIDAGRFAFRAQVPQGATGKAAVQNFVLLVPLGDPAMLFMKTALEGRVLKTMLVEAFPKGAAKPAPRAPFAARLSDVQVTSVDVDFEGGLTYVGLQPSRIEVFTAIQAPTGAMQPSQQFGWDIKAGKGM